MGNDVAPTGFEPTRIPSVRASIKRVLELLYKGKPYPTQPIVSEHFSKAERNARIRYRFANGEGFADLARAYELSEQRIFQIVHRRQH
jgi:hypothetical protein